MSVDGDCPHEVRWESNKVDAENWNWSWKI